MSIGYGWVCEVYRYKKGAMIFGLSLNTNEEYGADEGELFISLSLFKIGIFIGKFHYVESSEE